MAHCFITDGLNLIAAPFVVSPTRGSKLDVYSLKTTRKVTIPISLST